MLRENKGNVNVSKVCDTEMQIFCATECLTPHQGQIELIIVTQRFLS